MSNLRNRRYWRQATGLFWLLALTGCTGDPPQAPEARLRQTIATMQAAAEARDMGELMTHVADDYHDQAQRDKRELRQIARFYFMRHRQPHILVRIKGIEWLNPEQTRARVHLLAATAGRVIDDPGLLSSMRADLIQFELLFHARNDTFVLQAADWQHAFPADFLQIDDLWP